MTPVILLLKPQLTVETISIGLVNVSKVDAGIRVAVDIKVRIRTGAVLPEAWSLLPNALLGANLLLAIGKL